MLKRFGLIFAALLCLLALSGCKKEDEKDTGPWGYTGTPPTVDPSAQEGSLEGVSIRFDAGVVGFDTATSTLRTEEGTYTVDFSAKLAAMCYDMSEANFDGVATDLTYRTLTGAEPPEGTVTVTLTLITSEGTRTVTGDTEALKLTERSDISNFASITDLFTRLARELAKSGTPK